MFDLLGSLFNRFCADDYWLALSEYRRTSVSIIRFVGENVMSIITLVMNRLLAIEGETIYL